MDICSHSRLTLPQPGGRSPTDPEARVPAPAWIASLIEILELRFARPCPHDELAASVGMHPKHLARAFKRHVGCTIGTYIRNLRLRRALYELACPEASLAEIASNCGFADQAHFTRVFKMRLGEPPGAYRRRLGERSLR